MGYNIERRAIISVYPHSKQWADKVAKMKDGQVHAIYRKFKLEGKLK